MGSARGDSSGRIIWKKSLVVVIEARSPLKPRIMDGAYFVKMMTTVVASRPSNMSISMRPPLHSRDLPGAEA
jgi:hypothetical protein